MSFFLTNWHLFLVAAVSGGLLLWPALRGGATAGGVTAAQAVQMINRERATLVDVRDPTEFASGHVSGARNVPLERLAQGATPPAELPKNKQLPVVVVCERGAKAGRAVALLRKLGFEDVRPLAGGLTAWRAANLPLEKLG